MVPVHFSVAEVATGDPASHYVLVFQDVTTFKRMERRRRARAGWRPSA